MITESPVISESAPVISAESTLELIPATKAQERVIDQSMDRQVVVRFCPKRYEYLYGNSTYTEFDPRTKEFLDSYDSQPMVPLSKDQTSMLPDIGDLNAPLAGLSVSRQERDSCISQKCVKNAPIDMTTVWLADSISYIQNWYIQPSHHQVDGIFKNAPLEMMAFWRKATWRRAQQGGEEEVLLIEYDRTPKSKAEFENAISNGAKLRPVCDFLRLCGYSSKHTSGAWIFVWPDQYPWVLEHVKRENMQLRCSTVLIAASIMPELDALVLAISRKHEIKEKNKLRLCRPLLSSSSEDTPTVPSSSEDTRTVKR